MKTAVYNVRVDLRDIATLHKYYSNTIDIPSVSTLTRTALQFLATVLVEKRGALSFETTSEAAEYLNAQGLMGPLRRRGGNPLLKQMQKESLELEGIDPSYANRTAQANISPDQISKAKEILRQRREGDTAGAILGPNLGETKETK